MGLSLPMFLPTRSFLRRLIGFFAFAFMVATTAQAWAQASVETYTNQAVPPPEGEGLLPEGMEWNKPLKAGDLVLPRLSKDKPKAKTTQDAPNLPVGGLAAPQIQKPAQPPLLSSSQTSSASVMLMQGLKNSLQQAGQNTDIPLPQQASAEEETSSTGIDSTTPLIPPVLRPGSEEGVAPASTATDEAASASVTQAEQPASSGKALRYEPGQAPRNLTLMAPEKGPQSAENASGSGEIPSTEKSLAPSIDAGLPELQSPKATELQQAPVPLDEVIAKPLVKPDREESGLSSLFGSIFGPSVKEKEEVQTPKSKPSQSVVSEPNEVSEPAIPIPESSCETKVTSWTKDCRDAGYPASYTGKITGETRVECPGGNTQDVWISNTCAEAVASAEETPSAVDLAEQPKDLGGSASVNAEQPPLSPDVRVDANCGAANGLAAEIKPALDLCVSGTPSEVGGEGPWRWVCRGANGGMTVSCAAPVAKAKTVAKSSEQAKPAHKPIMAEDGKCGAAHGSGFDTAPTENLCDEGIASRVNGGGPWTWACSGTNGGQAAACSSPKKVDGVCGPASGEGSDSMPERDLCLTGYASAITGDGPWNWTCSGLYGGAAATCEASPKINAVCGEASLKGHTEAPTTDLCRAGEASDVDGEGPWTWTCSGLQGGASVLCKAGVSVDGSCGTANGQAFDKTPDENLCEQGHASRVTGVGPWNWSCSGLEGGETVSCTASLGAKVEEEPKGVACGKASEAAAFQAPVQDLCQGGKASAMTGEGPWSWSCSDDEGHTVGCTTLKAVEGACGTAANVARAEAPADNLCASGDTGEVTADKDKNHWSWDCRGSLGASTVSCSAPVEKKLAKEDAECGEAAGKGSLEAPTRDLCKAGKALTVRGKGPWTWSCVAKKGRHKVSCEAPKKVDGICGSSNGSIQKALPLTNLCAAGAPTEVVGSGPWLWSCIGAAGGTSVSCSAASQAQAKIDGACGASASAVMTNPPDANLCDSGVPSAVNGEGPWTWTCSGLNGGIASTCTTSKVLPKAPPPPGPPINAVCGPANGVAGVERPVEGLCSSGTATDVSGNGPWNWNCLGINGGMTVSCTAPLMPPAPIVGQCGRANGITTLTKPKSGLCAAGIASAVSGRGPWTWSCSGTNGGGAVSCVAPVAGKDSSVNPLPSSTAASPAYTPSYAPQDDLAPPPAAAPVGLVTPRLPSGPLPPLETGSMPSLEPVSPLDELSQSKVRLPYKEPAAPLSAPKPTGSTAYSPLVLDADMTSLSFDRGSDVISSDVTETLDKLSKILQRNENARITLNAYAGADGEITPREARRISLGRALNVRDYLTKRGVASTRIDVRALGANVPSGDMDRVDIKVN